MVEAGARKMSSLSVAGKLLSCDGMLSPAYEPPSENVLSPLKVNPGPPGVAYQKIVTGQNL